MTATRVAIYGAGELGRQVLHHLRHHATPTLELLGFIDDTRPPGEPVRDGLDTLGGLQRAAETPGLRPGEVVVAFAIGYSDMQARRKALDRTIGGGWALHTLVHPRAVVEPGVQLGAGCVVLANAVLDQQVSVGPGCWIDIGVRLTNGTRVGTNNYFSSGTSTGSKVVIGDDCFFGMDCTITTGVQLGSRLFVNAKTLVPRHLGDDLKVVELHKSRELPLR
jgi:PglD N-terminal domain/Hexapeptide repeat of succinyl-transferase